MTESCRLITTEEYKEWKASEKKLAELKQELDERFPYNCFTARLERERLQKKLDIATKALKEYADKNKWHYCSEDIEYFYTTKDGWYDAEQALKEMEGVK